MLKTPWLTAGLARQGLGLTACLAARTMGRGDPIMKRLETSMARLSSSSLWTERRFLAGLGWVTAGWSSSPSLVSALAWPGALQSPS